jgi:uncharacterized protein YegJ (DUF2314 family)
MPRAHDWDFVATGDLDGDATVDLLRQNTSKDETSEWLMSPGGSVGSFTFSAATQW